MKRLKRNSKIDVIRECVRECFRDGNHNYHLVIDKRNGDVVLLRRWSATQYFHKIGEVCTKTKMTEKNVSKIASQLLKDIKAYDLTSRICFSKAVEAYGKRNVIDEAFLRKVDNPHYKCAAPMRLYDKNVIEYHLKS